MANRAAGKGYENESFYENIKFSFLGIENIHVMRTSLSKLIESKYSFDYRELVVKVIHEGIGVITTFESSPKFYRIQCLFESRM